MPEVCIALGEGGGPAESLGHTAGASCARGGAWRERRRAPDDDQTVQGGAGGIRVPFDVVDRELRYRVPFQGLVDVLVQEGEDAYAGTATLFGRRVVTFRMRRLTARKEAE